MEVSSVEDRGSVILVTMKSPAQVAVEKLWTSVYPYVVCAVLGTALLGGVYAHQSMVGS